MGIVTAKLSINFTLRSCRTISFGHRARQYNDLKRTQYIQQYIVVVHSSVHVQQGAHNKTHSMLVVIKGV